MTETIAITADTLTALLDEHGVQWSISHGISSTVLAFEVKGQRNRVYLPQQASPRAWAEALKDVQKAIKKPLLPVPPRQSATDRALEVIQYRGVLTTRQSAYCLEFMMSGDKKTATALAFHRNIKAVPDVTPLSLAAAQEALAHLFAPKPREPARQLILRAGALPGENVPDAAA